MRHICLDSVFERSDLNLILNDLEPDDYIVSLVWETYPVDIRFFRRLMLISHTLGKNTKFVFNTAMQDKIKDPGVPVLFYIDFFAMRMWKHVIQTEHPRMQYWNNTAERALLLLGKPTRLNRIGLLREFWKRDLLDLIEWSLYVPEKLMDACSRFFKDRSEFERFLADCVRTLDPIEINEDVDQIHYNGFPYDIDLYKNTCCSIISETEFNDHNESWLTEKTWRTIINKHPFIMAGCQGNNIRLRELGFTDFMSCCKYDYSTQSMDKRIGAIVDNTEWFLTFCRSKTSYIDEWVDKNYMNYVRLVMDNQTNIYACTGMDPDEFCAVEGY